MQLKDGGSLAVVSGCPNRANGHTGVKGKAAQAALLQQYWEDMYVVELLSYVILLLFVRATLGANMGLSFLRHYTHHQ